MFNTFSARGARMRNRFLTLVLFSFSVVLLCGRNGLADCPPLQGATTHDQLISDDDDPGEFGAIAMDECGRFIVAWEDPSHDSGVPGLDEHIKVRTYAAAGTSLSGQILLSGYQDGFTSDGPQKHARPSIAMTPSGQVLVVAKSDCQDCRPDIGEWRLISMQFPFDSIPSQSLILAVPPESTAYDVVTFSAGIGDSLERAGWSDVGDVHAGLFIEAFRAK